MGGQSAGFQPPDDFIECFVAQPFDLHHKSIRDISSVNSIVDKGLMFALHLITSKDYRGIPLDPKLLVRKNIATRRT